MFESAAFEQGVGCPACAGIDRGLDFSPIPVSGLPRMRGDRPEKSWSRRVGAEVAPHARG